MTELDNIINDGFMLSETIKDDELDVAFTSLKIALISYFSTYQDCTHQISSLANGYNNEAEEDSSYYNDYYRSCIETIIHFQHFFELSCKKILKDEHPLLADIASTNPVILSKLLKGQKLQNEEENSLRSIEFSEAIKRLIALIKDKEITNHDKLEFIVKNKSILEGVNKLRNRIWHRGLFILRYKSLDKLVCSFILPLVNDFINLDKISGYEIDWKYKSLHCGTDPIDELIKEYKNSTPVNIKKIAFIKELGRAAYNNPLIHKEITPSKRDFSAIFDNEKITRAESITDIITQHELSAVSDCPVCGVKSLISYKEHDQEVDNNNFITRSDEYTYRIRCECCGLSLENSFDNAKDYGLTGIKDLWY
ncbi:TPA: hypothetical protein ACLMQJ_003640 [Yersinia enterocolitica]